MPVDSEADESRADKGPRIGKKGIYSLWVGPPVCLGARREGKPRVALPWTWHGALSI